MDGESNTGSGQPESTVAQNFAADLDSMFGLSAGVATLSQTVEEKKASVTSGQSELEQLEARLKATEQRLAKVSRQNSPSRQADDGTSAAPRQTTTHNQTSPLAQRPKYPDDRPPTQRGAGVEGPQAQAQASGRDDYVMVDGRST